jgi:hypothetical protein
MPIRSPDTDIPLSVESLIYLYFYSTPDTMVSGVVSYSGTIALQGKEIRRKRWKTIASHRLPRNSPKAGRPAYDPGSGLSGSDLQGAVPWPGPTRKIPKNRAWVERNRADARTAIAETCRS